MPAWIIPWIVVGLLIWPLRYVEHWMHRHVQGLGLLLTNDGQAAVLVYYLLFLPGVALHEISQWLLAKVLRVEVKKFQLWPERQKGGVIRLGLVEIEKRVDSIRATLIGMIPLVTGTAVIALIGSTRFDIAAFGAALGSGDLPTMLSGIRTFISTPDFWLWIYLIFAIANAMLPEEHDRIVWWLPLAALGAIIVVLLVLDLGILVQAGMEGPLAQIGRWLSLAFGIALGVDLLVMLLITVLEAIFTRVLDRELEYT